MGSYEKQMKIKLNSNAGLPLALLPISEKGAGPFAIMNQNEMHQTLQ